MSVPLQPAPSRAVSAIPERDRVRLTIGVKIALAVIGMVILSVGTMAWLTSQNLQRGFLAYLNQVQAQELDEFSELLAQRYREHGSFDWLRHNRRAFREVLESRPSRLPSEDGPPPGPPPGPDRPPPPPPEPRPPADPMGFGPRLALVDAEGVPVIGPPDAPQALERTIVVDGRTVGVLRLAPLRRLANGSGSGFVRQQIRDILWLALALTLFSVLLAGWLARRLLRPVSALRSVTQQLAQGQFNARASVPGQDELAELARHVNAMAQALERNEQQRRRMLADVSHELRTPLTTIRGEIEALLDGIRQADVAALESLHAEALRLNQLINDLHQLALADAGDLHYQFRCVDLNRLTAEILQRYRPRVTAAGLALDGRLPPDSVEVQADPDRIAQVITNLLQNSLRYTDAGGRIEVRLVTDGAYAVLMIEDTAPGVPDGLHARLFDRLYRVDQARSRERGGSGLGLSICKALADAHHGAIHAEPSTLGGVKIVLRVPLAT